MNTYIEPEKSRDHQIENTCECILRSRNVFAISLQSKCLRKKNEREREHVMSDHFES